MKPVHYEVNDNDDCLFFISIDSLGEFTTSATPHNGALSPEQAMALEDSITEFNLAGEHQSTENGAETPKSTLIIGEGNHTKVYPISDDVLEEDITLSKLTSLLKSVT